MLDFFAPQCGPSSEALWRAYYPVSKGGEQMAHFGTNPCTIPIYPYHKDWLEICNAAPYWVFDHEQSRFNLDNPLHVATYTGTKEPFENWHSSQDRQVKRLETLLFPQSAPRHLRINIPPTVPKHLRRPHKQINLLRQLDRDTDLKKLRLCLMKLADDSP